VGTFLAARFAYTLGVQHGQQLEKIAKGQTGFADNYARSDPERALSATIASRFALGTVLADKPDADAVNSVATSDPEPIGAQEPNFVEAAVDKQDRESGGSGVTPPDAQKANARENLDDKHHGTNEKTAIRITTNAPESVRPAANHDARVDRSETASATIVKEPNVDSSSADKQDAKQDVENGSVDKLDQQPRVENVIANKQDKAADTNKMSSEANSKETPAVEAASTNSTQNVSQSVSCSIRDILPHDSGKTIRQTCPGPFGFSRPSDQRRLAIIVRGESYRGLTGMYDRRIQVNKGTYECQYTASKSHVRQLIEPFKSCGYEVDVFITTWKANEAGWRQNSSQQMIDMYEGYVRRASFLTFHHKYENSAVKGKHPQVINFDKGFDLVVQHAKEHKVSWDAILIVRSDLIFKTPVLAPNVAYHQVMFAFREWMISAGNMVADTVHWFPWRYANCGVSDSFREHFSAGIEGKVGHRPSFFIKTRHDANAMADRNPLYKMCRPEQKYDFNGGFAIFLFGMYPAGKKLIEKTGQSIRDTLFAQGVPRALPAQDIYGHLWYENIASKKHVEFVVHNGFGQAPAARTYELWNPNSTMAINASNTGGWSVGEYSIRRVYSASLRAPIFKARQEGARTFSHVEYAFDRLVFARLDYQFKAKFHNVFECDTSKYVCIGYGASKYPTIPVVMIMPQVAATYFLKKSLSFMSLVTGDKSNATKFLEKSFGKPLQVICKQC
jgi:hypothetical protein